MRILIIEDETQTIELLYHGLIEKIRAAFQGALIVCVQDLKQADVLVYKRPYHDCIFLDLGLPPDNPDRVIDKIAEYSEVSPVVVVTGLVTPDRKKRLDDLNVVMAEKLEVASDNQLLVNLIVKALDKWQESWWKRVLAERERSQYHLQKLRELVKNAA